MTFLSFAQTVADFDGNVYKTIKIGNQVWMGENLRTTHYSDGTALIDGKGVGAIWGDFTTKYWFVFGDTAAKAPFGLLYTWAAAMNGAASSNNNPSGVQGVCPVDWHLPSKAEWAELVTYLGGSTVAGGKLKDTIHWGTSNIGATNESGFSAIPAGFRNPVGLFQYRDFNLFNYLWNSTESATAGDAIANSLYWYAAIMDTGSIHKEAGISVRCLKNSSGNSIFSDKLTPSIIAFPNPASDILNLKSEIELDKISITNVSGKVEFEKVFKNNSLNLNIAFLAKGIYILTVSSKGNNFVLKFVKL